MIIRKLNSKKEITLVRVVHPTELMLTIGFPRSRLAELFDYKKTLLMQLAGGAFSGYSVGVVMATALFAAVHGGMTLTEVIEDDEPMTEVCEDGQAEPEDQGAGSDGSHSAGSGTSD
jgi:hypothetical protein